MRAAWGACSRLELVPLVPFHIYHTLRKKIISGKPDIHDHDCSEHLCPCGFRRSRPSPFSQKCFWEWKKKSSQFVTGAGDWIMPTSLLETFLMMCRSTSTLSLLGSIEFFPNYWITMTVGLAWFRVCVLIFGRIKKVEGKEIVTLKLWWTQNPMKGQIKHSSCDVSVCVFIFRRIKKARKGRCHPKLFIMNR